MSYSSAYGASRSGARQSEEGIFVPRMTVREAAEALGVSDKLV
jgi:hypothetical protein